MSGKIRAVFPCVLGVLASTRRPAFPGEHGNSPYAGDSHPCIERFAKINDFVCCHQVSPTSFFDKIGSFPFFFHEISPCFKCPRALVSHLSTLVFPSPSSEKGVSGAEFSTWSKCVLTVWITTLQYFLYYFLTCYSCTLSFWYCCAFSRGLHGAVHVIVGLTA